MKRGASAIWQGGLKDGKGTVSTDSGVLQNTAYSFGTRFENGKGTNPEELVAAAHAGCFTMALSAQLSERNLKPEKLETKADLTFDKVEAGWTVTGIHLSVKGRVPGTDAATFSKAADAAKAGCPISRLLKTNITMDARLEG
jgi:osmotically inducible protein OsmC